MTREFYYLTFSECRKNLKLCKFVSKTHNDQLTPLFNSNVLVSWSQKLNIHFIVCLLFRGTMNITSTIRVCITKEKTRIKCAFGNAHLKTRVRKKRACVLRLRRTHISGLHCRVQPPSPQKAYPLYWTLCLARGWKSLLVKQRSGEFDVDVVCPSACTLLGNDRKTSSQGQQWKVMNFLFFSLKSFYTYADHFL